MLGIRVLPLVGAVLLVAAQTGCAASGDSTEPAQAPGVLTIAGTDPAWFDAVSPHARWPVGTERLEPAASSGALHDRHPGTSGGNSLVVLATSPDGARGHPAVAAGANDRPSSCDLDFTPKSVTLFNDPSGTASAQFRLLNHLVKLIDCTAPNNPDGTRASIKSTFYSLSFGPVRKALVAAARRGVMVQVLSNSHADRFRQWSALASELGTDTTGDSFAATCGEGCLRPRQPPTANGPSAWFRADATSAESWTVEFTDRSSAGVAPVTSWTWDFGDGTGATGRGPHSKTYGAEGIYTPSLTVRDSVGGIHRVSLNITIPDSREPISPALHAKLYLFSSVGTGRGATRWVSAFSSGNPTHHQAREGFNNLNVSVGDRDLYRAFDRYFADLVAGAQGSLLTPSYYRTVSTSGVEATGSPAMLIHLLPRAWGDVQLDVLRSIKCRYMLGGETRRTKIRISMYAFSRIELAAELWRLAYDRGCSVDLVYTTMTQRLRGSDGAWIQSMSGVDMPWGPADCLAAPPTRLVAHFISDRPQMKRLEIRNTIDDSRGLCASGTLDGRVAGTQGGAWVDRVSPITEGRLTVTAACPVVPQFDTMLHIWSFKCTESQPFTHQKVMLVDGMVHGKVQKYVMTGSANWSVSGLLSNDDVIVELQEAPAIFDAYLKAHRHQKVVLARARTGGAARSSPAQIQRIAG